MIKLIRCYFSNCYSMELRVDKNQDISKTLLISKWVFCTFIHKHTVQALLTCLSFCTSKQMLDFFRCFFERHIKKRNKFILKSNLKTSKNVLKNLQDQYTRRNKWKNCRGKDENCKIKKFYPGLGTKCSTQLISRFLCFFWYVLLLNQNVFFCQICWH